MYWYYQPSQAPHYDKEVHSLLQRIAFTQRLSTLTMFLGSRVIHWGTVARSDAPEPKLWPARGDSMPGMYMTALGMLSLSAKALPPTNTKSTKAMSGPNAYSRRKVGGEFIGRMNFQSFEWGHAHQMKLIWRINFCLITVMSKHECETL